MRTLKVIKSEQDLEAALARLETLMDLNPAVDSDEANELEVLSVLIRKYEDENVDLGPSDPIEAIKFRMDQQGLKNKDLTPYIGSIGKVYEILNGKRALSLDMIRALHKGLGIPYTSLIEDPSNVEQGESTDWSRYPLNEMLKRNLIEIDQKIGGVKEYPEEYIRNYFGSNLESEQRLFLRSSSTRSGREMKKESLSVWHREVIRLAQKQKLKQNFDRSKLDSEFFEELVRLSEFNNGPLLAKEFLARHGIHLVILEHFQKTYLDGAAIKLKNGTPIVALTIRYDRLDNFWFTLLHELAHVVNDLYSSDREVFFDDLDVDTQGQPEIEKAADEFAIRMLIPQEVKKNQADYKTAADVSFAAMRFKRSPAIIAGYIRKERSNYRLFNALVGRNQVRKLFEMEKELS
ncbi:MAG: ImmA/IrrE family metallo-endopeptidase [Gammaproteobacteria bacterium]|nr:ImmA/IrrE family metallo-endopeptidase [Gammaproteobacteria bacterium]